MLLSLYTRIIVKLLSQVQEKQEVSVANTRQNQMANLAVIAYDAYSLKSFIIKFVFFIYMSLSYQKTIICKSEEGTIY